MSPSLPKLSRSVILLAFAVVLLATVPAHAQTTILVPGSFTTIQSAINAANDGDTVLVSPGTYVENINFNGKAITVTSSGGASVTIIDGNHNGTVVTFNHSETTLAALNGFTIQNGFQDGTWGAGISITSASPTITSNIISGNHAAEGAGIYHNGGAPVIRNNLITANDQTGAGSGGFGGGGILSEFGPAQIISNTISNNSLQNGGAGGGISIGGSAVVVGNLVSGNAAYGDGGGISLSSDGTPILYNNVVSNNNTIGENRGGGIAIFAQSDGSVLIANNTIVGNTAYAATSGIYTTGFAQTLTFSNNIIVAVPGQYAVVCDGNYSTASPVFSHNDAFSQGGGSFVGFCNAGYATGNFWSDPLFLGATNGDYHLSLASPAVDAGDNSVPNLPSADFDGNPRIADGNNDGAAVIDLGAYELTPASAATLSPSSLVFSAVAIGSISSPQIVTLTSGGSTQFQVTSIGTTGSFSQSSSCPQLNSVAPGTAPGVASGGLCFVNAIFAPTTNGLQTGTLVVNGTNGASLTVALTGVGGTGPFASLSTTGIGFSNQPVGTTSAPQTVTVTNIGAATLNFSSISAGGVFSQSNNCGTSLGIGASCSIDVTFAPSAVGPIGGSLVIQDQMDGLSYSVLLDGVGVDFSVQASLNSLRFVAGASAQEPVFVTSLSGYYFPSSVELSCAGLPASVSCGFSPASVVPGSSGAASTLTISSPASIAGGTFPVTIRGVSGSLSHSAQVLLTIAKPGLMLSAPSLSFGLQPVGSSSSMNLTLTNSNTGAGAVTLSSISVNGPFVQNNNCGSTLPVNSSCTVSVAFVPTAYGAASGVLSIQDSVDALSYSVNLGGTGVDFAVSTAPGSATVIRGNPTAFTVSLAPLGGAYSSSVVLSCAGLPAGMSCAFSPQSTVPGSSAASVSLIINTDQHGSPLGTSTITIVGSSTAASHTTQVQLTVNKNKNN